MVWQLRRMECFAARFILALARLVLHLTFSAFSVGLMDRKAAGSLLRISYQIQKGASWIIRRQLKHMVTRRVRMES